MTCRPGTLFLPHSSSFRSGIGPYHLQWLAHEWWYISKLVIKLHPIFTDTEGNLYCHCLVIEDMVLDFTCCCIVFESSPCLACITLSLLIINTMYLLLHILQWWMWDEVQNKQVQPDILPHMSIFPVSRDMVTVNERGVSTWGTGGSTWENGES